MDGTFGFKTIKKEYFFIVLQLNPDKLVWQCLYISTESGPHLRHMFHFLMDKNLKLLKIKRPEAPVDREKCVGLIYDPMSGWKGHDPLSRSGPNQMDL